LWGVVPDRNLQRAHHGRPHVVLDVVVRMDTAHSPRLKFHARDTNLVTVDQSEWANARVGFGWQLRRGLLSGRLASTDVEERERQKKCPDNRSHGAHLGREG
jgi:hypothetical protein